MIEKVICRHAHSTDFVLRAVNLESGLQIYFEQRVNSRPHTSVNLIAISAESFEFDPENSYESLKKALVHLLDNYQRLMVPHRVGSHTVHEALANWLKVVRIKMRIAQRERVRIDE